MNKDQLLICVQEIVADAKRLKDEYTDQPEAPVNYACVFTHSQDEYDQLLQLRAQLGETAQETSTGPLIHIEDLPTIAGDVRLLKLRAPDENRPERGDADFTVTDYASFKAKYVGEQRFKLIKRENFEMIELADPKADVLAYFSHPPLDVQLGLTRER